MVSRRQLAVGAASLAAAAAIGVPMGLTQGGGTIDVFVGSTPTPTSTATPTPTPDPAADITAANLWMDTDGGTCGRQGTAAAYSSASACDDTAEAWAACQSGDTIGIKGGSYVAGDFAISSGAARAAGCKFLGVASETVTVNDIDIDNTDHVEFGYIDDVCGGAVDVRTSADFYIHDYKVTLCDDLDPGVFLQAVQGFTSRRGEVTAGNLSTPNTSLGDLVQLFVTSSDTGEHNEDIWFDQMNIHDAHEPGTPPVHVDCFQVSDAIGLTITRSVFANCAQQGIFINDTGHAQDWATITDVDIENNVIGDANFGFTSVLVNGVGNNSAADADVVFRNNVCTEACNFDKNPTDGIRGTVTLTGNYFGGWDNFACQSNMPEADTAANNAYPGDDCVSGGGTTAAGMTNGVATSVFVDYGGAPADDLHLASGANSLVDAITSGTYPTDDLDGNARPCGLGADIGAYERCGTSDIAGLSFDGTNDRAAYPGVDVSTGASTVALIAEINASDNTYQALFSTETSGGTSRMSVERAAGSGTGAAGDPVPNSIAYQKSSPADAVWTADPAKANNSLALRWTQAKNTVLVFVTKPAAGSSVGNARLYQLSGTTWNQDSLSPQNFNFQIGDGTAISTGGLTVLGEYEGTDDLNGYIWLAAAWTTPLTGTQMAAIAAAKTTQSMLDTSPAWLTDAYTRLFYDATGGLKNRSTLTGTGAAPALADGAWTFGGPHDFALVS